MAQGRQQRRRSLFTEDSKRDPVILWQSFMAARIRKENDIAHEKLCAYLHESMRQGAGLTAGLPPLTREVDRFGMVPCSMAFASSEAGWLLASCPSELLGALEEHVDILTHQLGSEVVTSDLMGTKEGSVALQVVSHCADFSMATARLAVCRGNHASMSQSSLMRKVAKMCSHLWKLSRHPMSEVIIRSVFVSLIHSVVYLHSILDPHRVWNQIFVPAQKQVELDSGVDEVAMPVEVVSLFVDVFSQTSTPLHFGWCSGQYNSLQAELLHLMGAIFSSSESNAREAAVSQVCLLLLTLLDPRETPSPLQTLAVTVVIKATHSLHCFVPESQQVTVDVRVMLSGFLNIFTSRYSDVEPTPPCYQVAVTMLDAVSLLCTAPVEAARLRQLLVELGCFIKITELVNLIADEVKQEASMADVLACSVLQALTAVMQGSPSIREAFERTVGYCHLRGILSSLGPPSKPILQQAFNMVMEGVYEYQSHTHSIYNTWALAMLLRWIPELPPPQREWVGERLYDIISFSAHNRQRCCGAGLITVLVEVIVASQEGGFSEEVEELLVHIMEVLGSHSIQTAELKQVIGALRPLPNGQLPTYYYRVQKALSVMSHDLMQDGVVPLYYFDLRAKHSFISIPRLTHFPSSTSLSFHTWVCLDYPQTIGRLTYSSISSRVDLSRASGLASGLLAKRRRILFSFYTGSGSGFEAFFTNSLVLVVAIATKKEFTTLALSDCPLSPLIWHSVCIVYHGVRRPWQKGEMRIYIDGELKRTATMKGPNLSETYKSCYVGSVPLTTKETEEKSPPTSSQATPTSVHRQTSEFDSIQSVEARSPLLVHVVGLGEVMKEWGNETNLRGLISSLCLFSDDLSPSAVQILHRRGPNDLSLFQPKCHETRDLALRLFVYYHAKACRDGRCTNLSTSAPADSHLSGEFTGQHYVTRDITAALGSLGGVGLLLPLLEQVGTPVATRKGRAARDQTLSPTTPTPTARVSPIVWFDKREGVASFFRLLLSMLNGSSSNQQVFFLTEGPATIGALLQRVPPSLLTVQALSMIQELVELLSNHHEQHWQLMTHLLFNFHIWSRPDFSVRIGHTQYISTVIRGNLAACRSEFGVQYFLDVIRVFYCSMSSHVTLVHAEGMALSEEETLSMRAAIVSIIKLHLRSEVRGEELDAILGFLAAASDSSVQEELLQLLFSLLTTCPNTGLAGRLWTAGLPLLVLIRAESMSVRLLTIKILSHLYPLHGGVTSSPLHSALSSGSLAAAVCQMAQHDLSSSIILALLELCVAKHANLTEYISNFSVYLSVLQLLRNAPLVVRYTICQQVISILHLSPSHVNEIATFPAWVNLFLWLLAPFDPTGLGKEDKSEEIKDAGEQDCSYRTVMSGDDRGEEPDVKGAESGSAVPVVNVELVVSAECDDGKGDSGGGDSGGGDSGVGGEKRVRPVELPQPRYRNRLSAFLHPTSSPAAERTPSFSAPPKKTPPGGQGEGDSKRGRSVTYSLGWRQTAAENEEEEVWRAFTKVTETIGYILWHSVDYEKERPPWKVWGMFLSYLDDFASQHTLIVPAFSVKQRIFSLLMNALRLDADGKEVSHGSLLAVVLQLSRLFEAFVISSYPPPPHSEDDQDWDLELLKLSHTLTIDLDAKHCSTDLLEHYLSMLSTAGVFQSQFNPNDMELGQSIMRVLLAAVANQNKEYYVTAAVGLSQLVSQCKLPLPDCVFLLGHLTRVLAEVREGSSDSDVPEQLDYIISVIRCVFSHHGDALFLSQHVPGLPDPSSPSFSSSFLSFTLTPEWQTYYKQVLLSEVAHYQKVLLPWLHTLTKHVQECQSQCQEDEHLRRELTFQNEQTYEDDILTEFFEMRDREVARQKSYDNQQKNALLSTLHRWKGTQRFFTGERGAWSNRAQESYLWKLDRTENFSRMRLRLTHNYGGSLHRDASQLRDVGCVSEETLDTTAPDAALLSLVKVSYRSQSLSEDDESLEQLLASEGSSPGGGAESGPQHGKEEVVKSVECDIVSLMDRVSGRLEITTRNIYFFSDPGEKKEGQSWTNVDFKIRLDQLRDIRSRRYNMQRTAIELFLVDQTNYFLNFRSVKVVSKVYSSIISLRTPNLNRVGIRKPTRLLQNSGLTQRWVRREMSNFDYIMQLNTIAGRTYNDLNQYPVFPWILVDYESEELDLENSAVFRDLTKPVGVQNPRIEESVKERFEEFDDPTMGKFHFGSHYSNAAGVLHYLIRLEPFTSMHIELQTGRFDHADRQFFSIQSSWSTIYKTGTDVKELIPEFYYLPELLRNSNGFDLGTLQSGERLGDVLLPKWASSPEDFIRKHRDALECEYVSARLHHWIDLIFGYKQIGPEAIKATNLFNYYSYEDNVNLEKIVDERERRQIESIINNFGQTPTQLFTEPHPQKQTLHVARKSAGKSFGKRSTYNLFDHLAQIKTHCVDISNEEDPVVFVGTPTIQTRALIASGNPEQLVTVTSSGRLNIHGWLPFSNSRTRNFTFQFDPNAHFERSKWQFVAGPFAQDLSVSPLLFLLSPNNKLLVSCGHWDNSFRVYSIEKGKLSARTEHHNDIVTCMALDKVGTGDHLITGSRDTTCVIWRFGSNETFDHPLQTLYGHDSEVTCVDISTELDVAVSGAKDGTCIIHTVRRGLYMHTLLPRRGHNCQVGHVAISSLGRILVYTEDKQARSKDMQCQLKPPCLHLYSINGALIIEKDLSECLNTMVIVDGYLITGNNRGFLTFRDLFSLRQLNSVNLLEPIRCVSVVLDHQTKLASHLLVGLDRGKLIIVSIKDTVSDK